jgi:hypothetical protein
MNHSHRLALFITALFSLSGVATGTSTHTLSRKEKIEYMHAQMKRAQAVAEQLEQWRMTKCPDSREKDVITQWCEQHVAPLEKIVHTYINKWEPITPSIDRAGGEFDFWDGQGERLQDNLTHLTDLIAQTSLFYTTYADPAFPPLPVALKKYTTKWELYSLNTYRALEEAFHEILYSCDTKTRSENRNQYN